LKSLKAASEDFVRSGHSEPHMCTTVGSRGQSQAADVDILGTVLQTLDSRARVDPSLVHLVLLVCIQYEAQNLSD
jgi:hypothetical protein